MPPKNNKKELKEKQFPSIPSNILVHYVVRMFGCLWGSRNKRLGNVRMP
jgi:hypothetical protein